MEVIGENAPPPTRVNRSVKQRTIARVEGMDSVNGFRGSENYGMSPIILSVEAPQEGHHKHRSLSPRTLSKFANGANARRDGPKIITWAHKKCESESNGETSDGSLLRINSFCKSNDPEKEDDFLYQNVSNAGTNYIEYKLNGMIKTGNLESEKNARNQGVNNSEYIENVKGSKKSNTGNRQIEVRQIKNKTVVKISIKEDEESWKKDGETNFRSGKFDRNQSVKELSDVKNYDEFENSKDMERFQFSEIYANLNASDPECDQIYENQDFEVLRKGHATQGFAGNNPETHREKTEVEEKIYENQAFAGEEETYENVRLSNEGGKSPSPKAFVRVNVSNPAKHKEKNYQSGEVKTISQDKTYQKVRNRKVVVTISSAQLDKSESDEIKKSMDYSESELGHKRAESLTSSGVGVDSEESDDEESNISCDSLNSNELNGLSTSEDHGYHTPNSEHKTGSPVDEYQNIGRYSEGISEIGYSYENGKFGEEGDEIYENFRAFGNKKQSMPPPPPPKPVQKAKEMKSLPKGLLLDIQSRKSSSNGDESDKTHFAKKVTTFGQLSEEMRKREKEAERPKIEEKTYEERKIAEFPSERVSKICAMDVDTDQFYKFHLFENRQEVNGEKGASEEETFAGVKDYLNREKQAAIKSAKGTIRGVKNRVKAGIATFLQMQENKTYKDKDAGKIVVYSTTMGIVRETYHKCLKVKQILRTLMVKFEERDVFMSTEAQDEIRDRMKCEAIMVPQVFVEGQHVGDAETIERLNESGELRRILKPYKSPDACVTCQVCGGYRLLPCSVCKGSKKSIHRNHFTAEFVALKCMNCDQVGLTKCYAC